LKLLIDIGHPAHVHYFKNFAFFFANRKDEILFTCRDKEVVVELLKHLGFRYKSIGRPGKNVLGKIIRLFIFDLRLIRISLKFRPDILLSAGSIYAAHVAALFRRPHITLEDTFNMEQVRLYLPFTSAVLTGNYEHINLGKREIMYNGFQELAYLHPDYFTPDPIIRQELLLSPDEKYYFLRFVSWNASHDVGQSGLSARIKREIIELLSGHGRVFISSEDVLPKEFECLRFPLSPDKIHHVLAFADLYVGEGATMASECAMLGTTAIYINSEEAGSIDEQEKAGLVFHFRDENGIIEKIEELLKDPELKTRSNEQARNLISNKIDLTGFLIWFVEHWPDSFKIMKEKPDYQLSFRRNN
jgi:predicted glycosyltransferase